MESLVAGKSGAASTSLNRCLKVLADRRRRHGSHCCCSRLPTDGNTASRYWTSVPSELSSI
jgi:hypothetical protein